MITSLCSKDQLQSAELHTPAPFDRVQVLRIHGAHVHRVCTLPAALKQAGLMSSQAGRAVDAFQRSAPALQQASVS